MAINTDQVLVSHSEIEQMLERLSSEINRDYGDEPLVVVGILTGAFIFTADLVRRLEMPVIVDFMQVSSYVGEFSTGELKIKKDMSYDIKYVLGFGLFILTCHIVDFICFSASAFCSYKIILRVMMRHDKVL